MFTQMSLHAWRSAYAPLGDRPARDERDASRFVGVREGESSMELDAILALAS
jgi:hypothetical protein